MPRPRNCYSGRFRVTRGVAQLGRALVLGTRGRRFKSCHPDLQKQPFIRRAVSVSRKEARFTRLFGVLKMCRIEGTKRPFNPTHLSPTVT